MPVSPTPQSTFETFTSSDRKSPVTFMVLLGRRDRPTDGVADYCQQLAAALTSQGEIVKIEQMIGEDRLGWAALAWLWRTSQTIPAHWWVVNYTAAAWSKRALPFLFLAALGLLKMRRLRVAVIFHDPHGYMGHRWSDRLRRAVQHGIMRLSYHLTDHSIFTVPPDLIPWLPKVAPKATVIPVGANLPAPTVAPSPEKKLAATVKTIAIFCISGEPHTEKEVQSIAHVVRYAVSQGLALRVLAFGRDSDRAEPRLRQALAGVKVDLTVEGLLPAAEIADRIASAHILLFVRGQVFSGRTTATAGIACLTPVVAYRGPLTASPLTEAGFALAPLEDRQKLAETLVAVLQDPQQWQNLYQRQVVAYDRDFAWSAIARQFLTILG